ncbi:hypothetical protein Acor_50400 [Acrocarpospora corrugata]|uniref:Secreted protein n=1 Tax=Acrocarpospora corrugata TaxID=35763 RepID=A0A5M3W2K1_9ACTN|nr:hypothetical protein [Acrocarpospora corrugata]GES02974.1 hypothetical protein Acor_50400 [Acrocarpospora corrugata]
MRKVRALIAVGTLVTGLTVVASATPAQADTLRNVYFTASYCYQYGSYGVQNGLWTSYHCDLTNGYWFLWSNP